MIRAVIEWCRALVRGNSMMGCEEALDRLFEYLDGELDPGEAARVEEHLEICKRCYPRAAFERSFLDALERARERRSAPEELKERVLAALREDVG